MVEKVDLILVPTDFSPFSCEAFSWAATFAERFHAKILILHVVPEEVADKMVSIPGNPWEKVLELEDKKMIADFSSCLLRDFSEKLNKEAHVAVGPVHSKIVEVAREKEAGMIVMTTHGRTGLSHVLMGSVAERVMRFAPCPVFSVKPKAVEAERL